VNSQAGEANRSRYRNIVVTIGALWLLLAALLFIYWQWAPARVEITWETATEQGTAGFNLYRGESEDGEFSLINEGEFVESRGSAVTGASYSYVDDKVVPGAVYLYILEEIETDGSRHRFEEDLFRYEVPGTPGWIPLLAAVCAIVGGAVIFLGLREGKK
jgi:hypothetical protein